MANTVLTRLDQAVNPGLSGATYNAQLRLALTYWQSCLSSGQYPATMSAADANAAIALLNAELTRIGDPIA